MSFKVGDKVIAKSYPLKKDVLTISNVYEHKLYRVEEHVSSTFIYQLSEWCFDAWFSDRDLRHATPEEIAAGHRIDHCVEATEKVELFGNSEGLEVLEMIDVSPNCEVSEL